LQIVPHKVNHRQLFLLIINYLSLLIINYLSLLRINS
jgi:hypothetical protein